MTTTPTKAQVFGALNKLFDAQCALFSLAGKDNHQPLQDSAFENLHVVLDEFGYEYSEWSDSYDNYRTRLLENN